MPFERLNKYRYIGSQESWMQGDHRGFPAWNLLVMSFLLTSSPLHYRVKYKWVLLNPLTAVVALYIWCHNAIVIANSASTLKAWSSVHALKCIAIHCCTSCAFHVFIECLLLSLNCVSELTDSRLSENGRYI